MSNINDAETAASLRPLKASTTGKAADSHNCVCFNKNGSENYSTTPIGGGGGGTRIARRILVVVFLMVLVGLVLWCTPLPDPYYASCDRPCHELDWPMICRFRLVLEASQVPNSICKACQVNASHCPLQCMANGMLPGPTIQVCENDIVVVDVVNRAPGHSLGIHWGGQTQREFPYMDGVPQISQCPINPHTIFQYKFRATGAGTHLWSAAGSSMADCISGPLIVKQAPNREPHRDLFDFDLAQHVFTFSMFSPNPKQPHVILINGQAHSEDSVPVHEAGRHRLRLLYSGGTSSIRRLTVSVEGHSLLLIALDGHPIEPQGMRSVMLSPGERADVVLNCDLPASTYLLTARSNTGGLYGSIPLQYSTATYQTDARHLENSALPPLPTVSTFPGNDHVSNVAAEKMTLNDLCSVERLPEKLLKSDIDIRLYLPFDFISVNTRLPDEKSEGDGWTPAPQMHSVSRSERPFVIGRICNISLALPSSPILIQPEDAEVHGTLCRGQAVPAVCPPGRTSFCECTHIIDIPLGSSVEVILADQGGDPDNRHVFHLHGYSFWMVGSGKLSKRPAILGSPEEMAKEDESGRLVHRNLQSPVIKDTVEVPRAGVVALRFIADNPGYWLLHDRDFYRQSSGLGVIFHVGEQSDLPSIPDEFPRCGSFVGPKFFLI